MVKKNNTGVSRQSRKCPESASNFYVNLTGALLFLCGLFGISEYFPRSNTKLITLFTLGLTMLPIILYDFFIAKVHHRRSAQLQKERKIFHPVRYFTKLAGLGITLVILLAMYWLHYKISGSKTIEYFFSLIRSVGVWSLIPVLTYFYWVDRYQTDGQDEYWQAGCLVTGQWKKINYAILTEHFKSWTIKGFFIPYVLYFLSRYIENWNNINWTNLNSVSVYNSLLDLLYMVDILFGVLGYIFTCRVFDTHIRSTEPTLLGWLVCFICYGTFYTYFGIGLLQFNDGLNWNNWTEYYPVVFHSLGIAIILLTTIYTLATVAIGTRMSNLTYRGVITSGPYRFCKHPAYFAKVASWWLITLPFLSSLGAITAIKHSSALLFISFIYYLRALTEENHLSNYPEYVDYARWINDHGILSPISRLFPSLQYSPEKRLKWGSVLKEIKHV